MTPRHTPSCTATIGTTARRRTLGRLLGGMWLCACAAAGAAGQTVQVEIRDYKFTPARIEIKVGTTVNWINRERRTSHSVLFTGPGGFESERLFAGDSWQRTFDTAGSYPYRCGPHPEMTGQIEVTP